MTCSFHKTKNRQIVPWTKAVRTGMTTSLETESDNQEWSRLMIIRRSILRIGMRYGTPTTSSTCFLCLIVPDLMKEPETPEFVWAPDTPLQRPWYKHCVPCWHRPWFDWETWASLYGVGANCFLLDCLKNAQNQPLPAILDIVLTSRSIHPSWT